MAKNSSWLAASDLDRLVYPAWLSCNGEGTSVAYSLFEPDADTNGFSSVIHLVDGATGLAVADPLRGDIAQFAPQGHRLAYLATSGGEKQIWLREGDGAVRQLTHLRHGVNNYAWSKDGSRIVFEAPLWQEDMDEPFTPLMPAEKDACLEARRNSPVVIEELMYKFDETYGVVDGSVPCLGLVDIHTGQARLLTDGEIPCYMPAFSPDGQVIAFYGRPYSHHKAKVEEVFVLNLSTGSLQQLTFDSMCTSLGPPIFTGDGDHIIFSAYTRKEDGGGILVQLLKVPTEGGEVCNIMPADDDIGLDNLPTGRSSHGTLNPVFQLSPCGEFVYYTAAYQGSNKLYRLSLSPGGAVEQIPTGQGSLHAFCPPVNNTYFFTRADMSQPCQLYRGQKGHFQRLSDFNAWIQGHALAGWQELWVKTKDGAGQIQGWVLTPPGFVGGQKYPAVLNVHGGPTVSFVRDFNLEFQAQAASGLVVLLCNPRGSSGYGRAHTDMALAWGQEAIDDLFSFVDAALNLGFIDSDRLGITGGSYGGYMTIKIIGRSTRFKAACAQRALCNTTTSYGTGDMGFLSAAKEMPDILDFLLGRVKTSYINQVDNIHCPLLLLHGTHDYRCSFEQAEQMFIAMKDRRPDIPVRLVAFPSENHNVSRTGRPLSQRIHMQELIDWFLRFLKGEAEDNA